MNLKRKMKATKKSDIEVKKRGKIIRAQTKREEGVRKKREEGRSYMARGLVILSDLKDSDSAQLQQSLYKLNQNFYM